MNMESPAPKFTRVPTFVDLPVDAADAEARFRALPPGASMVYARGEHRGPAGQKMLDLCTQGRALLVQRRVGPVEAMCRDYIAIKSVRA